MEKRTALSIGYSPCPNDTFMFYALVHGLIPMGETTLLPPVLEDVETLNQWALQSRLQVSKLSFHALGHVLGEYVMLRAGAALGRGCGPLLVAGHGRKETDISAWTIAVPGQYTTAALLLRLCYPEVGDIVYRRFDQIMQQVRDGFVDAGVIIHESRFTYPQYDLVCLRDLGAWWEQETGLPIPLGCIAARRDLPHRVLGSLEQGIRESVRWARENPAACRLYVQRYAQEMEPMVLDRHIALYVNDFSVDLGPEGMQAVETLLQMGKERGIFPDAPFLDRRFQD